MVVTHVEAGRDPFVVAAATMALVLSVQAIIIIAFGSVRPRLDSLERFIGVSKHGPI